MKSKNNMTCRWVIQVDPPVVGKANYIIQIADKRTTRLYWHRLCMQCLDLSSRECSVNVALTWVQLSGECAYGITNDCTRPLYSSMSDQWNTCSGRQVRQSAQMRDCDIYYFPSQSVYTLPL